MGDKVTIFSDADYAGTAKFLDVGRYNTGDLGIGNDALSSLRVPAGFKVTLYENADFSGRSMICVADTPSMGRNLNDVISSIVVEAMATPRVVLYTDRDYVGWSQELGIGRHSNLSIGSDALTSLRVPPGFKVTMYENADFTGRSMISVADTPSVGDTLNDRLSSVVVEALGTPKVILYADAEFCGESREIDVGSYGSLPIGNDRLSSIKVPAGYKVTLFENGLNAGRKMICLSDMAHLGDGVNDQISAALVEKGAAPRVILYSDSEYRGWSQELGTGRYGSLALGGDTLSSLRVPPGYKVTLFEHSDFGGRAMHCVMDTPSLGDNVNDEVSSAVVEASSAPRVILYNDDGFTGWSCEYDVGEYSLSDSFGNDRLSSLIVPSGYKVTLFEDAGFSGGQRIVLANSRSLPGFDDRATCMRIEKMQSAPAPTLAELRQLIERVAPRYYLHPSDPFGPSSVDWFLQRATLKCLTGESRPATAGGLPAGGSDDGLYWLESDARGGDLSSALAYVNAKYYTYWIDLQFWFFYPYNGAGRARLKWDPLVGDSSTQDVDLERMGQHGGDWEHVTVRVQLAPQTLLGVYMAAHSGGEWVMPSDLQKEGESPVVYSSRHGHAAYKSEGMNGSNETSRDLGIGTITFALRNDTAKGTRSIDCRSRYQIVGADFLGTQITPPAWLSYCRRWGPHVQYDRSWIRSIISGLLGFISLVSDLEDKATDAILDALPDEFKEENGPTGPSRKGQWSGQE